MHYRLLSALVLVSAAVAQEEVDASRFRLGLALAGGTFDYETEGTLPDGDADAGLFRLDFEATGRRGIGGGLTIEALSTDDLAPGIEARQSSIFMHFTYRLAEHRFAMPMRAGLRFEGLVLESDVPNDDATFSSVGPYFEIEPEFTLARSGSTAWSLYGELGFGGSFTSVEIDGDSNEYESSTSYFGLEVGTRLQLGSVDLGVGFIGRWRSMDESDPENGLVVVANDTSFTGVLFSVGVVF